MLFLCPYSKTSPEMLICLWLTDVKGDARFVVVQPIDAAVCYKQYGFRCWGVTHKTQWSCSDNVNRWCLFLLFTQRIIECH